MGVNSVSSMLWYNYMDGGGLPVEIVRSSFVHLVMYGYYFLRTVEVYIPIWIKALITNMQMIQVGVFCGIGTAA